MADQAPRFLGRAAGYVGTATRSIDTLEALDEDALAEVVAKTQKKALDDRIRRRQATAAEIQYELNWIDSRGRYLRRELARLKR
jgi:hypothetical protein